MRFHYLDTSALAKLVHGEPETAALTVWVGASGGASRIITSDLGHTELRRTLHRIGGDDAVREGVARLLAVAAKIRLTAALLGRAGDLAPDYGLRSLDAIHAAAALSLGAACESFVTYDKRQAKAAALVGLTVVSPV